MHQNKFAQNQILNINSKSHSLPHQNQLNYQISKEKRVKEE